MIKDKFLETVEEYKMFASGDLVLVAVSGGADSTALLNLLHDCRQEIGISLHVAHLNHMLRKGDSDLDARYVEGLAQKLSVPVSVEAVDVAAAAKQEKIGIEEAARRVRYEFFEKAAKKIGANKIAVGHTADDNVETFLMRLLRGAGLKGLCGIPPKRGKIVRPLIKIWRREIEDYVGGLKLVPRRDHTNYESRYMRNSVRLKLIPQLKVYNLNIKEVILQTILLVTEDNLYLENKTFEALEKVQISQSPDELKIDLAKMQKWEPPIQGHLLRKAIEAVKGDLAQLSFVNIRDVLDQLGSSEKWELHLPDGIFASGERGVLSIRRGKPEEGEVVSFRYTFTVPGEVRIKELGATLRGEYVEQLEKGKDQRVAYLDNAGLGKEIVVRSRQAGDRFSPLGVKGTKKLQDFFVDEKIPQGERDRIPIVESGGKIIWVAGRRIDERARVSETTRRIVKLQLL